MNIVIIGATSNICKIRVFENLNQIQEKIKNIVCVSRKNYTLNDWKNYINTLSINNNKLLDKIDYIQCNYQISDYRQKLYPIIQKDTIIYVSTPPCCYRELIEFINEIDMGTLVLEKPLSLNYQQYRELKPILSHRIHMIDHFLYKVDVQKIINNFADPIQTIHFRFLYTDDVEDRLGYFDQSGFFIDMFQSHFLSILYCFMKDDIKIIKNGDIKINRKQYLNYGGSNKDIDTYFYLTIKCGYKVMIFEAGKAMKEVCKEIIINGCVHPINNYQNEYSLFFLNIHNSSNLILIQETFWEITEYIKTHFNKIDYYPKNNFKGSLEYYQKNKFTHSNK